MDNLDKHQKGITDAVDFRGKQDIADSIGMPDAQDYEVLMGIFRRFNKKYPGYLKTAVAAGRRDYETGRHRSKKTWTGKTTVNTDSNMTYVFELPAGLYQAIEAVFPSMFKSRRHFAWFKKNFYKLTISGEDK